MSTSVTREMGSRKNGWSEYICRPGWRGQPVSDEAIARSDERAFFGVRRLVGALSSYDLSQVCLVAVMKSADKAAHSI